MFIRASRQYHEPPAGAQARAPGGRTRYRRVIDRRADPLRRHRVVAEPGVAGLEGPDVGDAVVGHLRDPLRVADLAAADRDQVEVAAVEAADQLGDPARAGRVAFLAVQR